VKSSSERKISNLLNSRLGNVKPLAETMEKKGKSKETKAEKKLKVTS